MKVSRKVCEIHRGAILRITLIRGVSVYEPGDLLSHPSLSSGIQNLRINPRRRSWGEGRARRRGWLIQAREQNIAAVTNHCHWDLIESCELKTTEERVAEWLRHEIPLVKTFVPIPVVVIIANTPHRAINADCCFVNGQVGIKLAGILRLEMAIGSQEQRLALIKIDSVIILSRVKHHVRVVVHSHHVQGCVGVVIRVGRDGLEHSIVVDCEVGNISQNDIMQRVSAIHLVSWVKDIEVAGRIPLNGDNIAASKSLSPVGLVGICSVLKLHQSVDDLAVDVEILSSIDFSRGRDEYLRKIWARIAEGIVWSELPCKILSRWISPQRS